MPQELNHAFVVFDCSGKPCALPLEKVRKIVPMADLIRPPNLAVPLEGILNFAGRPLPVVRLGRLLGLSEHPTELYSMLVVLKGGGEAHQFALLVDRVLEIVYVSGDQVQPVEPADSFNACVEAAIHWRELVISVLSADRILLEKERASLSAFGAIEMQRLADWEMRTP
jgi:chemotaxis signal transduction protein